MNISYKWLKQYVDFDLSPDELAALLTSTGLETGSVEEVESIRGGLRGLVIGHVLTCEPHPDSDHLHVTTVDLGDGKPTQIVCGAPNVAAGQTVVVATVGTKLYDGDKEFTIKRSKIRGVESLGMICAEDEIGVGASHDGIIVITDREVKPGTPAAEYFGLDSDYVLEVDLTPNRIDAASHFGVARDVAAWLSCHRTPGVTTHRPDVSAFRPDRMDGAVSVSVSDTTLCPRYSGVTIRGIRVGESPKWLRDRLTAIGQRSINNIVDITNYILHGFGQPLHCFDLAKVDGERIEVKTCQEGTPFTTLDGVERKLSAADLMICSASAPMCIAGVFGGLDSGVTEATTDIFIESACFNPTSVRRTARRHGLSTDASFRYERGTDPNATMYMLRLAALMVKELAGGEICGEPVDIYPEPVAPYPVTLSYGQIDGLVGKHIEAATVDSILASLDIDIASRSADGSTMDLKVATYRVDVRRPCDVIEEILRIYGYNNVEMGTTLQSSLSYRSATDIDHTLRVDIAQQLTAEGFNEILNNSLTAESYYAGLQQMPLSHCVRLLNPLSSDLAVMRQTLLFGGLESLAHNINRKISDLAMYEFGHVYSCNPETIPTQDRPLAPFREESHLALWLTGAIRPGNWARQEQPSTFFDLKAAVANIFARLGISDKEIKLQKGEGEIYSSSLDILTRSGKPLGSMGIVAPAVLKTFDIKQPVAFAELRWQELTQLAASRKVTFRPLPRTMPVQRDLALLVDRSVTFDQIERAVAESEKRLLRGVNLFDVYEGKNLPEGKKSYAISITLQDDERTLVDQQIEAVMERITANLAKRTGATLR